MVLRAPAPPPPSQQGPGAAPGSGFGGRGGTANESPNSGLRVSNNEIANVARNAGFRDDTPPTDPAGQRHSELAWAVAIALAESGGDRTAVGHTGGAACGEYVVGLWQICSKTLNKVLFDKDLNGERAWSLYESNGRSFEGRWSVFPDPARAHLPQAEVAVKATHRDRPFITRPSAWPGFSDILEALSFFVGWITDGQTWIRLGETIGGGVLILLGIILLYLTTKGRGR